VLSIASPGGGGFGRAGRKERSGAVAGPQVE